MARKSQQYWKNKRASNLGKLGNKTIKAFRNPTVGSVAAAAWRGVKYIRSLINVERKFTDKSITGTPVLGTPVINNITSQAQGATIITRTGNSILLKTVQVKGNFIKHSSATNTLVKLFIVEDLQQVADTDPVYTDIMDAANDIQTRLNLNTLGRFKIHYMSKVKVLTANNPVWNFNIFKKYYKHHVRYNGVNATDYQKGHLYLVYLTSEATNTPTVNIDTRISFFDN